MAPPLSWLLVLGLYLEEYFQNSNMCSFLLHSFYGYREGLDAVNWFNNTRWVVVVTPTDRPKVGPQSMFNLGLWWRFYVANWHKLCLSPSRHMSVLIRSGIHTVFAPNWKEKVSISVNLHIQIHRWRIANQLPRFWEFIWVRWIPLSMPGLASLMNVSF